jgi:hypothetical protein
MSCGEMDLDSNICIGHATTKRDGSVWSRRQSDPAAMYGGERYL